MYIQGILEVVIGLVFLWLVISIATMSIQDWIANILNLRANALEKAIGRMLGDKNLLQRFYNYPLITSLYKHLPGSGKSPRYPDYIPAAKFSATVFDLILQAGAENSPVQKMDAEIKQQLGGMGSPEFQKTAQSDWDAIVAMAGKVAQTGFGAEAIDSLKFQVQNFGKKYPEFNANAENLIQQIDGYFKTLTTELSPVAPLDSENGITMRQFMLGVQAMMEMNPKLGQTLQAVLKQAEGYALQGEQAVATTRTNLETWFNDAMDRLSTDYRQKAQTFAFIIGMLLTLIFNIDSISTATVLWKDPTLRQVIVAQAQVTTIPATSQNGSATLPTNDVLAMENQLQALNFPYGWKIAPFDAQELQCSLLPVKSNQVWGIPGKDSLGAATCGRLGNLPIDLVGWLVKAAGLLITGLAAAQGAPFWFDVIKKLIGIRNAGSSASQQPVG